MGYKFTLAVSPKRGRPLLRPDGIYSRLSKLLSFDETLCVPVRTLRVRLVQNEFESDRHRSSMRSQRQTILLFQSKNNCESQQFRLPIIKSRLSDTFGADLLVRIKLRLSRVAQNGLWPLCAHSICNWHVIVRPVSLIDAPDRRSPFLHSDRGFS